MIEDATKLIADAIVPACYDEDFPGLRGEVSFGEEGWWGVKLSVKFVDV